MILNNKKFIDGNNRQFHKKIKRNMNTSHSLYSLACLTFLAQSKIHAIFPHVKLIWAFAKEIKVGDTFSLYINLNIFDICIGKSLNHFVICSSILTNL